MTQDRTIIDGNLAWLKDYGRLLKAENTTAFMLLQADREDAINRDTAIRCCEQEEERCCL